MRRWRKGRSRGGGIRCRCNRRRAYISSRLQRNVALHICTVNEPFALQSLPTPSSSTYSKTSSTQFHTSSSNNSPSSAVSFPPLPSPRPTTNHSRYRFAAIALVFRSSERITSSSALCVSFSRSATLSLPRPAAPVGRRCRVGREDVSNCDKNQSIVPKASTKNTYLNKSNSRHEEKQAYTHLQTPLDVFPSEPCCPLLQQARSLLFA